MTVKKMLAVICILLGGSLVQTPQVHAQAAPSREVCDKQISDVLTQISNASPQLPVTMKTLEGMHCQGSRAACTLGADHLKDQIAAKEQDKAEKTRGVQRAVSCTP
jgi:hypothetical protein